MDDKDKKLMDNNSNDPKGYMVVEDKGLKIKKPKKNNTKIILGIIAIGLIFSVGYTVGNSSESNNEYAYTDDYAAAKTAAAETYNSNIQATYHDEGVWRLENVPKFLDDVNIQIYSDTDVEIEKNTDMLSNEIYITTNEIDSYFYDMTDENTLMINNSSNSGGHDKILISVPSGKLNNVVVYSSSGDVVIEEIISSNMELSSESGKINIEDIHSDYIALNNSSGKIEIDNVKSPQIDINSASGNIEADDIYAEKMITNSVSGNIDIDFLNQKSLFLETNTTSGNIDLSFPKDVHVSTTGGTDSGKFTSNIMRSVKSSINAALQSATGNITLNYDD